MISISGLLITQITCHAVDCCHFIKARSFSIVPHSVHSMNMFRGVQEHATVIPGNIDPGVRLVAHKTPALAPVVGSGQEVTFRDKGIQGYKSVYLAGRFPADKGHSRIDQLRDSSQQCLDGHASH